MLRWVILSVVVVALAAAATFLVQSGSNSTPTWDLQAISAKEGPLPKAEVEGPPTHEFGMMATQRTGTKNWKVRNKGDADLELFMISSTCMCTIAKFSGGSKAVVKPGESTEIALEWKTNNAIGDYSKGATIGTNDPGLPEFKLGVHGIVHAPIVIVPEIKEGVLPVGTISNDEPRTTSIALFSPEKPDFKLTKISTSKPDQIVVKPIPLKPGEAAQLKTKGGYRLDIEIKPGMAQGNFRDSIVIENDNPDQPKVELTLTGFVTGAISVMPANLRMLDVHGKEGGAGQLTLIVRGGKATKFTVAQKPEKLQVAVVLNETPSLKGRYRLTVTVPPGTPAGLVDGEIVLHTDHPKVKELKIPVNILVNAG
jgi:hypothetical protein